MSHRDQLHLITVLVAACVAAGCGDDDVGATDGSLAVDAAVVDTGVPDSWLFTPTAWRGAMGLSARSSLGTLAPHRFASFIGAGGVSIPAAFLRSLLGPNRELKVFSEAATSLTAGPVEIRLETTRQATAPGGAFFAGKLIRQ